jgi:hypothetical protein
MFVAFMPLHIFFCIRSSRICWELVLCSTEEVGIRVYYMPSSPIIIVTKRVWRCRYWRCYMAVCSELRCFGMRLENIRFLDPTYWKILRDKFIWWDRTWRLRSQDRRVMPTIDEENWVLKLEIIYTLRCHLWEDYDISRYEANSHIGSLVRSRSQRRHVK